MKMKEFIKKWNNQQTHIEIDNVDQAVETGGEGYTYTIYLIDHQDGEPMAMMSVDAFSEKEMELVDKYFTSETLWIAKERLGNE